MKKIGLLLLATLAFATAGISQVKKGVQTVVIKIYMCFHHYRFFTHAGIICWEKNTFRKFSCAGFP